MTLLNWRCGARHPEAAVPVAVVRPIPVAGCGTAKSGAAAPSAAADHADRAAIRPPGIPDCAGWNSHMTIKNTRRTDVFDDFFICFAAHNLIRIFLPEKEYFDQPPEYYPLVNGKRVLPASRGANLTQICYSNPDAKQEITKNLFKVVEQNPEYDIYGICQEDNMDKIMFERFCQTYKEATAHIDVNYRHAVPVVATPPSFDSFLKQAPWTLATPVTDLKTEFASSKPASEKTDIRVLADAKNLYLAGRFSDQFGFLSFASEYKPARDLWPAGNKVEICLSPDGKDSYQYVIDFNGNLCDLKNRNFKWDSKADLKVERDSDGWSAMLTIPLADLGATSDSPLAISFIRYIKDPKNASRGTVVWRYCVTDNTATFIPVDFKIRAPDRFRTFSVPVPAKNYLLCVL